MFCLFVLKIAEARSYTDYYELGAFPKNVLSLIV